MNSNLNDVEIVGESIPNNASNFLMSGIKVKKEKETSDSTNSSSTTISISKKSFDNTAQKASRLAQEISSIVAQESSAKSKQSRDVDIECMDITKEIHESTLIDLTEVIKSRKPFSSASILSGIGNVNMHEFLKSTPTETFSRKGFYSCAGCSSKFTCSDEYNFHVRRNVGEFVLSCELCKKQITCANPCQVSLHNVTHHKQFVATNNSAPNWSKVAVRSMLSGSLDGTAESDNFEESAKISIKKMIENQFGNCSIDIFNQYVQLPKDQRYYLLPMARRDVVQSHKFYSDHFRAANHKLKDQPVELLHCFMCDFVCDNQAALITHLQGGTWPHSVTKCAFCNLALPLDKENFCAAKAHVLLHMGVYIMCPRCGFVPPPDLNPDEFEITLRLHLRFVCFHFNSIQIYVCPICTATDNTCSGNSSGSSRAFNNSPQVMQHIYEEHLPEVRHCFLCRKLVNGVIGAQPPSDLSAMKLDTMAEHCTSAHNRTDTTSFWNECISAGKQCGDCSEVISQKELFYSHANVQHKTTVVRGTSAFRCFGSCKRIHQTIDEFQHHRSECSQCINVKARLYQPQLATSATPEFTSLCFCLWCGIGVRRKKLGLTRGADSEAYETQSEPHLFADLARTHDHEQMHILHETNQTACPWCGLKITAKVVEMTRHMQSHLPQNWFLSWYSNRIENYKSNPEDVLYCHCQAAIDNPMSLHCHSIPQNLVVSGALTPASVAHTSSTTGVAGTGTVPPRVASTGPQSATASTSKHLALTDTIYREMLTSAQHQMAGSCPLCNSVAPATASPEIFPNTLELSWHIFIKHRTTLCYVCKDFRIMNNDSTPDCRVMMWTHIYGCLRRHTPRFNMTEGLLLLLNIANCQTAMKNCRVVDSQLSFDSDNVANHADFSKSSQLDISVELCGTGVSDSGGVAETNTCASSASTECANNAAAAAAAAAADDQAAAAAATKPGEDKEQLDCVYCLASLASVSNGQSEYGPPLPRFGTKAELQTHLTSVHGLKTDSDRPEEHLCFVCGLKFDSRDSWEDHSLAEHSRGFRKLGHSLMNPSGSVVLDSNYVTYRCYLCNHRFEKKTTCEDHMIKLHAMVQTEINWGMLTDTTDSSRRTKASSLNSSKLCVTTWPSKRLKLHHPAASIAAAESAIHEEPFVCALCPFECIDRAIMSEHGKSWHSHTALLATQAPVSMQCPDCCLSFRTSKAREIHLLLIHKLHPTDSSLRAYLST